MYLKTSYNFYLAFEIFANTVIFLKMILHSKYYELHNIMMAIILSMQLQYKGKTYKHIVAQNDRSYQSHNTTLFKMIKVNQVKLVLINSNKGNLQKGKSKPWWEELLPYVHSGESTSFIILFMEIGTILNIPYVIH